MRETGAVGILDDVADMEMVPPKLEVQVRLAGPKRKTITEEGGVELERCCLSDVAREDKPEPTLVVIRDTPLLGVPTDANGELAGGGGVGDVDSIELLLKSRCSQVPE